MLGEYRIGGRGAAEIAASIERAVGEGALAPGHVLPPQRELAADLGVNANTVAAAYRALRERGVIETAGRRGSRVRGRPATSPREAMPFDLPPGTRDISKGNPDPALLPPLADALAEAAKRAGNAPVLYGEAAVDEELAELARARFDADGVPPGPVGVASGALDTIERVLLAWLRPGDAVAVEDPGWAALLDLVAALGLRPVPCRLDDEGPRPEAVAEALRAGARAVVVTARAQNPTGAAVTPARARELRALFAEHPQTLVIEDDHGRGIVSAPLNPVVGSTERWVEIHSLAKSHGPDLRVAAFTGDRTTVDRVRGRQRLGPGWVSLLLQRIVAHLWRTGAVDAARVAATYDARRDRLLHALAERGVEARGRSGLNVWVPVPDETRAVAQLLRAGWAVAPGARFRVASPQGIRLTVVAVAEAEVEPLAAAVADAARPAAGHRFG
ncbi:aminotransferase class I/II-fold pyridoxal phosphate-dependent enzyme [Streptomyces sp. 3MP-14]|uniref:Aminotransferase class I/II-fold pyridoxal phosphate-dependent enzyme n=1 Tax=Streptomyces mimosae TaxID=2586635 RepID=A0A5N5ZZR8_9ACTN|nr:MULTISPECIES: aminotransferase class I/II-fold pyridoxal phosphate-dependent enzyme [Streptomyces]KAB8161987.1 aminotransferase class I/II-fold pyridoxal phosphate-dependent enzyme [Streptomyces mimosae]KAB8173685.1 aminotransferase class I/II-fold pyridoxal phosphate-dependent enzyme [Streptomyces sp. 3MP-14]